MVVVSRDKDLQQLLSHRVSLLDPGDGSHRGPDAFQQAFGFEPPLFPDYQAFTGDSVDNIPGIRGIGPKAAGELIRRFGPLESVYESEDRWREAGIKPGGKLAQRLVAERDTVFLFREILRLDAEAPLPIGLAETKLQRPDADALWQSLDQWELREGLGGSLVGALNSYLG